MSRSNPRRCKRASRRLSAALVLLCVAASVQARTSIGVSMALFDDNFLTSVREAMADEARAAGDVDIQFLDAQSDVSRQLSQVQNFVARRVDAIIVIAVDTSATKPITRAATGAGIPLVYVNRHPDEASLPHGVVVVASDERLAGRLQMTELARLMGGRGNVAIMLGDLANNATRGRTAGVKEVLSRYPDIKVVEEQSANFDRIAALDLMSNWIVKGTKIDAVAANNDDMAIGALLALRQISIVGHRVFVGGVDATQDALAQMQRGRLHVTVFQNAKRQGARAVDDALGLAHGESVAPIDWIPFELVVPANMRSFESR
jgi:inositol transport system substrate-binding protein